MTAFWNERLIGGEFNKFGSGKYRGLETNALSAALCILVKSSDGISL
jgi:hypothetical protein